MSSRKRASLPSSSSTGGGPTTPLEDADQHDITMVSSHRDDDGEEEEGEEEDTLMVGEEDIESDEHDPILDESAPSASSPRDLGYTTTAAAAHFSASYDHGVPRQTSASSNEAAGNHRGNGASSEKPQFLDLLSSANDDHHGNNAEAFSFAQAIPEPASKPKSKRGKAQKPSRYVEALMGEAYGLYSEGRLEDTLEKCREILTHPNAPNDPYQLIGNVYEELGETEKAVNTYLALSRVAPKAVTNWKKLGEIYQTKGSPEDIKEAMRCLQKVVRLNKDDTEALMDLAYLYTTTKEYRKATRILRKLLTYPDVNLPSIYLQLAENLYHMKNVPEAIEVLQQCMEFCLGVKFSIGSDESSPIPSERWEFSNDYLHEAFHAANMICELYSSQGAHSNIIQVVTRLQEVVRRKSADVELPIDLICKLAIAQLWEDKAQEANDILKRLWECNVSEYSDLFWDVGEAFRATRRPASALVFYEALKQETSYNTPTTWKAEVECLQMLHRTEEECSKLTDILSMEPGNIEIARRLGTLLISEFEEYDKARSIATNEATLHSCGFTQQLSLLGDLALRALDKAVDHNVVKEPVIQTLFRSRSARRKYRQSAGALVKQIYAAVLEKFDVSSLINTSAWECFFYLGTTFVARLKQYQNEARADHQRAVFREIGLPSIAQIVQYICAALASSSKDDEAEAAVDAFMWLPKSRKDASSEQVQEDAGDDAVTYNEPAFRTGSPADRARALALQKPEDFNAWNDLGAYYYQGNKLKPRNLRRAILRMIQEKGDSAAAVLTLGHISHDICCFDDSATLYFRAHCLLHRQPGTTQSENAGNGGDALVNLCLASALLHKAVVQRNPAPHTSLVRVFAWLGYYQRLRLEEVTSQSFGLPKWTLQAECDYNLGRFYHHLGFISLAVDCYDRVLLAGPSAAQVKFFHTFIAGETRRPSALNGDYVEYESNKLNRYDATACSICEGIKRLAAHNLCMIMKNTNTDSSRALAGKIAEQYLTA